MRSQLPRSTTSQPMSWPLHRSGSSTTGTIGSIAHQRTLGSCEPDNAANEPVLGQRCDLPPGGSAAVVRYGDSLCGIKETPPKRRRWRSFRQSAKVAPVRAGGQIQAIWVHERHRRQGLGRALVHAAESEAVHRGCEQVVLMTHSFQAPEFYEHLGYERKYAIEGRPKGYTNIVYVKRLTGTR